MRKLIAIFLALLLVVCLIVPASAATTMRWDWGKARQSIGNAAAQIVQEQQTEPTEATEPSATEYTMAATEPAPVAETDPEPVEETRPAYIPSWRDWLTPWARLFGSKE